MGITSQRQTLAAFARLLFKQYARSVFDIEENQARCRDHHGLAIAAVAAIALGLQPAGHPLSGPRRLQLAEQTIKAKKRFASSFTIQVQSLSCGWKGQPGFLSAKRNRPRAHFFQPALYR